MDTTPLLRHRRLFSTGLVLCWLSFGAFLAALFVAVARDGQATLVGIELLLPLSWVAMLAGFVLTHELPREVDRSPRRWARGFALVGPLGTAVAGALIVVALQGMTVSW